MKKYLTTIMLAFFVVSGLNAQKGEMSFGIAKFQDYNKSKKDNPVVFTDKNPPQSFYQLAAKDEVIIGTGTDMCRFPIYPFFKYSYSQNIYLQSEIGAADDITKIWFYFNGSSLSWSNEWVIYIGHTTKTLFNDLTDWIPIENFTEVYNSSFVDPGGPGWIEFDITDFAYNGIDNLVIAVDENKGGGYNGSSDRFYSTDVGVRRSMIDIDDFINPDPASPSPATYVASAIHVANVKLLMGTPPDHDLGVTALVPSGVVLEGSTITPQVTIHNSGLSDEAIYSVELTDGGAYTSTVNVTVLLAVNGDAVIDMDDWEPANGTYTLTATVTVIDDTNPANDTLSTEVVVKGVGTYTAGNIYAYDASGTNNDFTGKIPIATGVFTPLINPGTSDFLACGENINGTVYGFEYETNNVYLVLDDGNAIQVGTLNGITSVTGFAYDKVDNVMYASSWSGSISSLYTVDTSWNCTLVGTIGTEFYIGIASDADGNLFGIEMDNDNFSSIDKATGAATVIGAIGVDINYAQDIGGDHETGVIYGTIYTDAGRFGTFDKATGAFTEINNMGDEITMCAVIPAATTAPITFVVDNNANTGFTGFALIGSWDALGNYDAGWNGGAEHTDFYDDGTHGDITAGDDIWTVTVNLVPDGGTNSWEWGVNDQDGNWIDGNFTFTVIDTTAQTLDTYFTVGIKELAAKGISIYPNPSNGVFTVSVNESFNLEVVDISGKVISTQVITGNSTIEINNAGVYSLRFSNEKDTVTQRVIIQ